MKSSREILRSQVEIIASGERKLKSFEPEISPYFPAAKIV